MTIKEIPVKLIDELKQQQQETDLNDDTDYVKTEKVVNTNYTQIITTALVIFFIWFVWGMYLINAFTDTWIQDNISKIITAKKQITTNSWMIESLIKKNELINSGTINKAKKVLKETYKIIYN